MKHKRDMQKCQSCKQDKSWDNFEVSKVDGDKTFYRRICKSCQESPPEMARYTCRHCRRLLPASAFDKTKHRVDKDKRVSAVYPRIDYQWNCRECAKELREVVNYKKIFAKPMSDVEKLKVIHEENEKRMDKKVEEAEAAGMSYGRYQAWKRRQALKYDPQTQKDDSLWFLR